MVNCQGCGEETSSRLCCPKCSEYGRTSFFCSQDCFVSSWPSHSKLHVIIRQIALSNNNSLYDGACTTQSLNADETTVASPATTAASVSANGEDSLLYKKVQSMSASVHASEPRSRSRILSRAGSETELPVVNPSASSSSFSRVSSTAETTSSASAVSRGGPPALSHVRVASADDQTAHHSGAPHVHMDSPVDGCGIGNVFTAVRSLLLSKPREITSDKASEGRPAASATTAAAVRVTQAMRSVFSTSHNRHHAVPWSDRKKEAGRGFPVCEASGRAGAASSVAGTPPPGVGFCRCVILGVICTFSLFFMWLMRRILFDAGGTSSYYTTRTETVTPTRSAALSDSDDIIDAVLARIGARPYGEEISALQASVQDIRNELAAVTTLVQQHGAVIDQFVDRPDYSGRRQGGAGGAINQAISANLEGGPPLPDVPQLKLPVLRASADLFTEKGVTAGLSQTAQQEAVANPHAALRPGETVAAGEARSMSGGLSPQKFYEARVAVEENRANSEVTGQQPQLQEESGQERATENVAGANRLNGGSANNEQYLNGSLMTAAVKSASRLNKLEGDASKTNTELHLNSAEGGHTSSGFPMAHEGGGTRGPNDLSMSVAQEGWKNELMTSTQADYIRSAPAFTHAPQEEEDEEGDRSRRDTRGADLGSTGFLERGGKEVAANLALNEDKGRVDVSRQQSLRGQGKRQQGIRKEREDQEAKKTLTASQENWDEQGQANGTLQRPSFGLAGVKGRSSKRVEPN